MDDYNPRLLLVVTYNEVKNKCYFKILNICKKTAGDVTLTDEDFKEQIVKELKRNIPSNLFENLH